MFPRRVQAYTMAGSIWDVHATVAVTAARADRSVDVISYPPGTAFVVPVAGEMLRVQRRGEDDPLVTTHGRYRFVPLVN